jgi:hypothetical protein
MIGFLRPSEANLVKRDYKELLASCEAVTLSIAYKVPVNPVYDPVYKVTTADSWTNTVIAPSPKAIQQIVKPVHYEVLKWGILEAGDCIFYLPNDIDLSSIDYDTCEITAVNVTWIPVPVKRKEFWNYLIHRLGDSQIGQVIPCKIKQ